MLWVMFKYYEGYCSLMTTISKIEKKCPVCGKPSQQSRLSSTNTWTYPDLDLRPSAMQRSTMFAWLMECPHCGYVSKNFDLDTEITEEFLQSRQFLSCEGFEFKNDLSKKFFRAYIIAKKSNDSRQCFFNLLYCAWKCDDAEDPNAVEIRKMALSYIDDFEAGEKEKRDLLLMKADLLRRIGQFDKLIEEFSNITIGDETYDKIISFQIEKAGEKDTACYTGEDVFNI